MLRRGRPSISWPSLGIFNESSVLVDADEFAQLTVVANAENNCRVSQSSLEVVTLPEPVMSNETILCEGDGVLLDPILGDDNAGWAFQWTFNGNTLPFTSTGLLVEEEGSYCVTVPGTGCPASYDDSDCAFVELEGVQILVVSSFPVQVPDEPGNCLTLEMDSIPFVSEGAVTGLYVNMEHSYMGDLSISLICPNGQTLTLHSLVEAHFSNPWTMTASPMSLELATSTNGRLQPPMEPGSKMWGRGVHFHLEVSKLGALCQFGWMSCTGQLATRSVRLVGPRQRVHFRLGH